MVERVILFSEEFLKYLFIFSLIFLIKIRCKVS